MPSGRERVLADAAARGIPVELGEHGLSVFVDVDALVAGLGAVMADITDPALVS